MNFMVKVSVLVVLLLLFMSSFVVAIDFSLNPTSDVVEVDYVGDSKDLIVTVTNENAACNIDCSWDVVPGVGSMSEGLTGEIMNGASRDIPFRITSSGVGTKQFVLSVLCWDSADTWPCNKELSKPAVFDMEFGYCGDGELYQSIEECDGNNHNAQNCMTRGFDGGTLRCFSCGFDTSDCYKCGDGNVDSGEKCDGSNLGGGSCVSLGYVGGSLSCSSSCDYNEVRCESEEDNFKEEITGKILEVSAAVEEVSEDVKDVRDGGWLTNTRTILTIVAALLAIGAFVWRVYFWKKGRKNKGK